MGVADERVAFAAENFLMLLEEPGNAALVGRGDSNDLREPTDRDILLVNHDAGMPDIQPSVFRFFGFADFEKAPATRALAVEIVTACVRLSFHDVPSSSGL